MLDLFKKSDNLTVNARQILRERWVMAIGLFLFGVAESVTSIMIIIETNGTFVGGIYLGGLAIVLSIFALFHGKAVILLLSNIVLLLAAITASVLQGIEWVELYGLKACSVYTTDFTTSCTQYPNYYYCYGKSGYFKDAEVCAASYQNGMNSRDCSCVKSSSSYTAVVPGDTSVSSSSDCFVYKNIDCHLLVTELPNVLLSSFVFAMVLAIFGIILVIRWTLIARKPVNDSPPPQRESVFEQPEINEDFLYVVNRQEEQ